MKMSKAKETFVEDVIASLSEGVLPWEKPWDSDIGSAYNAKSNKKYKGLNQITLLIQSIANNYDDPRWLTFKQAKELGYTVMKGQKGTPISFFSFYDVDSRELYTYEQVVRLTEPEQLSVRVIEKTSYVFNARQIDGMPLLEKEEKSVVNFSNDLLRDFSKTLINEMNVVVREGWHVAEYDNRRDRVNIPDKDVFKGENEYYGTLFHELAHATGHESRLNREIRNKFGSDKYAIEELRAEFSSVFLNLDLNVSLDSEHKTNHKAYLQSWASIIKNKPEILFSAIKDAQKISDYMLEKGDYEHLKELALINERNDESIYQLYDEVENDECEMEL
ncbi:MULTISPECIES: zincin-like metallopeptidase domain-containing protein [unclassified Breznakia]|uniref:ArdC family protein n=1 Tax=unclassified Breznakia TaxID=2623764 RepID=UPI0024730693|nr:MULTISPECIES: zincin-like metallopeptidase domain-containing protein [unclassified Breznakia]MDH6367070.1 antirestriction protein ArdC [Breznakia sp. PH1-1]MDH6404158.1 antirestriction protein ArdC [Breznakia sp. PF1-11]MDH6411957.1 antirestriction protein ArdC [Breznakia sp. PFB1-11]MDH6414146.1 antirestriction protein ArdC [Breznakia sp. PFB1-14]MDH6418899.1 antirestriction protein ArdC [Breznakia sp. PFB1-12]